MPNAVIPRAGHMAAQATGVAHDRALREPGSILLVSCYELGHTPHGLSLPLAFLRRAGFEPACVDLSVSRRAELSDLDAAIRRARLVAISVPMHTAMRMGVRLARRVRQLQPDARLCFFGLYAPLNADYLLSTVSADWVLGGECEDALVALARDMDHASVDLESADSQPTRPGSPIKLGKLAFPQPARAGMPPLSRYAKFDPGSGTPVLAGYTETSRGCLDTCRHCPVPAVYQGRFFVINADTVLADIGAQVAAGARHITFGDPDFLNGPGHGMAILRHMHARWPRLTFDITAQIAHLAKHASLLPELVELGCAFVVSAVESLSDAVLEKLRKQHRRADFEAVLAVCRKVGLVMRPTFVTFTPWTRLQDVRELCDVLVSEQLVDHVDPVQLTIRLLVPPGSLLLEAEDTRAWFSELDPEALTHLWVHQDPRVDALQQDLAQRVALGAENAEAPAHTFAAVRERVYQALGEHPPPVALLPAGRKRVPRITEPWFC